jgi:hypothetical protein
MGDYRDETGNKAASVDYWRQYTNGFNMCHFPRLAKSQHRDNDESRGRRWESSVIEFDSRTVRGDLVQQFCASHRIRVNTLFEAAWALVIGKFTGNNDVGYTSITVKKTTAKEEISQLVKLCQINLDDDEAAVVTGFLGIVDKESAQGELNCVNELKEIPSFFDAAGRPLYNTTFVFQEYGAAARLREADEQEVRQQNLTKAMQRLMTATGYHLYRHAWRKG